MPHPEAVAVYPDWATIDERGRILREERLADYELRKHAPEAELGNRSGCVLQTGCRSSALGPREPRYTYCGDMEFWLRVAATRSPGACSEGSRHASGARGSASVSARGAKMATSGTRYSVTLRSRATLPAEVRRERYPDSAGRVRHRPALQRSRTCACRAVSGEGISGTGSLHSIRSAGRVRTARPRRAGLVPLWRWVTSRRWGQRCVRPLVASRCGSQSRLGLALLRLVLRIPSRTRPHQPAVHGAVRVLHAFSTADVVRPGGGDRASADRTAAGLLLFRHSAGVRNRHENDFIGALPGKYYDLPPEKRLPIGRVSDCVRYLNLVWGILQRGTAIARALKHDSVDTLIACTGDQIDPPAAFLAARILRCRYFMYFFDDFTEQWWADPAIQKVIRRIERVLALRADGLISPNEYMQQELLKRYQKPSFVVRNPTPRLRLAGRGGPVPLTTRARSSWCSRGPSTTSTTTSFATSSRQSDCSSTRTSGSICTRHSRQMS